MLCTKKKLSYQSKTISVFVVHQPLHNMILVNGLMIAFNIPLSLIGSILNVIALYCLWCTKRNSTLSNSDKLILVLNTADTVFSAIILPTKVASYILEPDLRSKPRYHCYMDAVNIFFTSFVISLIAFNRYIKISKASRHHVILSRTRLRNLLITGMTLSLMLPTIIFLDLIVFANLSAFLLFSTNIQLIVFYALITRTTRSSRRRINARTKSVGNSIGIRGNHEVVVNSRVSRLSHNVLILMSAYFFCCFCLFAMLINLIVKPNQKNTDLIKIGVWFMSFNSVINPIIYTLRNRAYQRILISLFRKNEGDISSLETQHIKQIKVSSLRS